MARPPKTFNEFIGQRRVLKHLERLIAGARELGEPCPSLLLVAPSGFGKTSLAGAVAHEYGGDLHILFAGDDILAADVCKLLLGIKHGDVLFVDEAYSLRRDVQEVFYPGLDQNKVPALNGGRLNRTCFASIAHFTLILSTNQPGSIQRGLRARLSPIEFDAYTIRELKAIAERVVLIEEVGLTPQAARRLAETAQGTPRSICRSIRVGG